MITYSRGIFQGTERGDDTPPAFLWHTREDAGVPPENSLLLAAELCRHGVAFELHVWQHGRHGLSLSSDQAALPRYLIRDELSVSGTGFIDSVIFQHRSSVRRRAADPKLTYSPVFGRLISVTGEFHIDRCRYFRYDHIDIYRCEVAL